MFEPLALHMLFFYVYLSSRTKTVCLHFLKMQISVNMRTKRATKFLSKYEFSTRLPHPLTFLPKRRIIALCKEPEQIEACLNAGAMAAGGTDIVTRIETGGFHWDEYDDVVAHPDFLEPLHRLRKVLRNRIPTVKNGRIGENVATLVGEQQESIILTSSIIEGVPEVTQLMVTLGQLSWDIEKLNANLMAYLQALEENKSSRTNGEVVERIEVECLPCDETLLLDPAPILEAIRSRITAEKTTQLPPNDDELEEVTAVV
uniref:50S ribosomal protein L1 n=1 Tax=Schistocephalus solidus TaxID=70667 RepID=A0A0X3PJ82_SCHSO